MNPEFQNFLTLFTDRFPHVKCLEPHVADDQAQGHAWFHFEVKNEMCAVEHRPGLGFGLYIGEDEGFGSGPEEIYKDADSLLDRLDNLMTDAFQQ